MPDPMHRPHDMICRSSVPAECRSSLRRAPIAIGHRGAPRLARENTLESFALAARHGADCVELDVHRTLDGHLVVAHDADLLRLWGVDREIADLTLAEVATATGGEVRPLASALEANRGLGVTTIIDVSTPRIGQAAAELVAAQTGKGDIPVGATPGFTGNPEALVRVRTALPEATLLFSWESPELPSPGSRESRLLDACQPQYFNQDAGLLSREMVTELHCLGYLVSTYTVDTAAGIDRVLEMGVDAVISNDIDLLRNRIAALATRTTTMGGGRGDGRTHWDRRAS